MKTLQELRETIIEWVNRDDLSNTLVNSFIRLAETKIFRSLRIRENEFQKRWTAADNPFNPIDMPQNFKEVKSILLNNRVLERISTSEYNTRELTSVPSLHPGDAAFFAVTNRQLYIYPWPDESQTTDEWGDVTIELNYYGTESLTEMATWDTPTNANSVPESDGTAPVTSVRTGLATGRVFQVAPDMYLYGALSECYTYLREPQKAQEFKAMFSEALMELNMENAEAEFAGSVVEVSSIYHDQQRTYRR